jgi:hypothetical protein
MKRTLFAILTVCTLAVIAGCASDSCNRPCSRMHCQKYEKACPAEGEEEGTGGVKKAGCLEKAKGFFCKEEAPEPPPAPTAYPYYTTRGPRDFYTSKPYASIGP